MHNPMVAAFYSLLSSVGENFRFNKGSVMGPSGDSVFLAKYVCFRTLWNIHPIPSHLACWLSPTVQQSSTGSVKSVF